MRPLTALGIAWSDRRVSNSRPLAWEASALPLSYYRLCLDGAGHRGSKERYALTLALG